MMKKRIRHKAVVGDSLKFSFKPSDPKVQKYIDELEATNLKLHEKLNKFKAENLSLKNQIKVLEEELEKERKIPKIRDFAAIAEKLRNNNQ